MKWTNACRAEDRRRSCTRSKYMHAAFQSEAITSATAQTELGARQATQGMTPHSASFFLPDTTIHRCQHTEKSTQRPFHCNDRPPSFRLSARIPIYIVRRNSRGVSASGYSCTDVVQLGSSGCHHHSSRLSYVLGNSVLSSSLKTWLLTLEEG